MNYVAIRRDRESSTGGGRRLLPIMFVLNAIRDAMEASSPRQSILCSSVRRSRGRIE